MKLLRLTAYHFFPYVSLIHMEKNYSSLKSKEIWPYSTWRWYNFKVTKPHRISGYTWASNNLYSPTGSFAKLQDSDTKINKNLVTNSIFRSLHLHDFHWSEDPHSTQMCYLLGSKKWWLSNTHTFQCATTSILHFGQWCVPVYLLRSKNFSLSSGINMSIAEKSWW